MKILGVMLLVCGAAVLLIAINIDTTVEVPKNAYTDNISSYMKNDRVNNIGLIADKQNKLLFGGIIALVGAILFVGGNSKENKDLQMSKSLDVTCPGCDTENELDPEEIKAGEFVCGHCSQKVII